ncbi:MAG: hypothetical protein M3Q23_09340 [Actinomycetota bacterium]|nr:hypothetical protein [Actinomycetota bacterium]
MRTRFSQKLEKLQARVLDGPGRLQPSARRKAFEGHSVDDALADRYVQSIHRHAYRIVDRNIDELREAGWSEDQIFELSISAAFGAARHRLDTALRALEAARTSPGVPSERGA